MKSAIEEIYLKQRGNCDSIELSEKYKLCIAVFNKREEEFLKLLDEPLKARYKELHNLHTEAEAENYLTYYKEGLKLGMRLATEALSD